MLSRLQSFIYCFLLPFLVFGEQYISPSTETLLDGQGNYSHVQQGDTVLLEAGTRPYLIIRNFSGTENKPIVFQNYLGQTKVVGSQGYGISVQNTAYFKLLGNGSAGFEYGIFINVSNGSALGVGAGSSEAEVAYVEATAGKGPGFLIKTDPSCDFSHTRDKFVMRNVRLQHNYIHHTDTEGIYLGSTFYTGTYLSCNGKDTLVFPHIIEGAQVYENRIEYTGWDGIQVASTTNASVFGNKVLADSQKRTSSQMNGIIVGNGTSGEVYHNIVSKGEGTGIITFTDKSLLLFGNVVLYPGYGSDMRDGRYGIYCDRKRVTQALEPLVVANNLVIGAKTEGLRFVGSEQGQTDSLVNNILILPADKSLITGDYINMNGGAGIQLKNEVVEPADFSFYCDYRLEDFTICNANRQFVNQGVFVSAVKDKSDLFGQQRVVEEQVDLGPVEWQEEVGFEEFAEIKETLFFLHNQVVTVELRSEADFIRFYDLTGKELGVKQYWGNQKRVNVEFVGKVPKVILSVIKYKTGEIEDKKLLMDR